jgi:hypothetical protein
MSGRYQGFGIEKNVVSGTGESVLYVRVAGMAAQD